VGAAVRGNVPRMARFEVQRHDDTSTVHLALRGDLDLYSAPALDDALVALEGEKWPRVVIDLRALEFVDSAGLRLIVRTQARAVQDGRELVLVRGGETVQRVFTLTGLDRELTMVDAPPPGTPRAD
jgi:anti-sigma B factor antagonist